MFGLERSTVWLQFGCGRGVETLDYSKSQWDGEVLGVQETGVGG